MRSAPGLVSATLVAVATRPRAPAPVLQAPGEAIIHVWGLPWELSPADVADALEPLLTDAGFSLVEPPLLPLDRRARRSGRALLRLINDAQPPRPPSDAVDALQGQNVGERWLEVRESGGAELEAERRAAAERAARASERAPQSFSRPTAEHAALDAPATDRRDFVLLSHESTERLVGGTFELNNLREGRVDVLARAVAAALMVSHGVRRSTRLWLALRDVDLTICCDGATAKGLSPDERSIGAALRRSLYASANGEAPSDPGWHVYRNDPLKARLQSLVAPPDAERAALVVLHELGDALDPSLIAQARSTPTVEDSEAGSAAGAASVEGAAAADSTVVVLGDHLGFSNEEEALLMDELRGVRASVSPVPLLASHCIVLAHAVLDRSAAVNQGKG